MAETEGKYVDNIARELHGVIWLRSMGLIVALKLPPLNPQTMPLYFRQYSEDNKDRTMVECWLSLDPSPSWRRLVVALEFSGERWALGSVMKYVEPLTDPSLTAENVSSVLETLRDWKTVRNVLSVPHPRSALIEREHSTDPQWRQAVVQWWLRCSPTAFWTWLAGRLYRYEEKTALRAVSQYIRKEPADSTLTIANLTAVTDTILWELDLHQWLQIPDSVYHEITQQITDPTERSKALLERWLRDHPAPSWALVAEALHQMRRHEALKQVKKTYLTGSARQCTWYMPSILHDLAPAELENYRSRTSFILRFPHSERNDIFHSLIAFLISEPHAWKLAVQLDSTTPVCLSRNCVVFSVPDFPGTITLINSHKFYEVHISARIKHPKLCPPVRDRMIAGLEKAVADLPHINCHPEITFPCPCGQGELHPATVSDDETLLCSISSDECGILEEEQLMWNSKPATGKGVGRGVAGGSDGGSSSGGTGYVAHWVIITRTLVISLHCDGTCRGVASAGGSDGGTAGYSKLQCKRDKIIRYIADLRFTKDLAEKLLATDMINRRVYDLANNVAPGVVEVDRATVLFNAVLAGVKLNPAKYDQFICILKEIEGSNDLVVFIEEQVGIDSVDQRSSLCLFCCCTISR